MGVIGTYALGGDWIEVHAERRPAGYGRLALERVERDGSGRVRMEREYSSHRMAVRSGEVLVLARGGLLGQGAPALAGGRVERRLAREMFAPGELARWVHMPAKPDPPSRPDGPAAA